MSRVSLRSIPALVLLASACGGPDQGDGSTRQATADSSATAAEAHGVRSPAPRDSVIAWAAQIRESIQALPALVATDPEGARQRAVEFYVTRQERIEQAAGPGTGSPADLAESVHQAEARFHELMQLLGETPPPDAAAVSGAVGALDARLAEVIRLVEDGDDVAGAP